MDSQLRQKSPAVEMIRWISILQIVTLIALAGLLLYAVDAHPSGHAARGVQRAMLKRFNLEYKLPLSSDVKAESITTLMIPIIFPMLQLIFISKRKWTALRQLLGIVILIQLYRRQFPLASIVMMILAFRKSIGENREKAATPVQPTIG